MQTIIGFYDPANLHTARQGLIEAGITPGDILEITSEDDIPDFLEGEPERRASQGWLAGSIIGALIGAVLAVAITYLTYNPSLLILTLIALVGAGAGAALGGYLFSIYSLRADTEAGMGVRDALGQGQRVLLVRATDADAKIATAVMEHHHSDRIDTYPMPIDVEETELA